MIFDDFIEKVANDIDVEKERDLIKKVQANPNDNLAWKQLNYRFKPLIQKAVASQSVHSDLPKDTLEPMVQKEFKRSILNYDNSASNKPSTYIYKNITSVAKKENDFNMFKTKMPANLAQKASLVYNAKSWLASLGNQNPTNEQIYDVIKNQMNRDIDFGMIQKILDYNREHLSTNIVIGTEGEGENITFGDTDFGEKNEQNIDDYITQQRNTEMMNNALNKLSPKDRDLLMQFEGMGKYKDKGKLSKAQLAFNNNLGTSWNAGQKIKEIEEVLKNELNNKF